MKHLVFIGDSNCMFFAQDKRILRPKDLGHHKGFRVRKVDGNKITYIWKNAKVAHTITDDFLNDLVIPSQILIGKVDHIIFCFGTVDVKNFMHKYDNYKESIDNYFSACVKFTDRLGASPIFLMPIVTIEKEKYFQKWVAYFLEKVETSGIGTLINPFDIIDRDYKSEEFDKFDHLNFKDSDTLVQHICRSV